RRAIHIEAVPGWHHKAYHVLRHTETLHRFHCFWQRRFTAGGRECQRSRLTHRPHKLPQRHACDPNHQSKGRQDENHESQIKRADQFAEIHQHPETLSADRVSHRCAHPDWRKHHHIVGKLKHHLSQALHGPDDWFSFFA